MDKPFFLKDNSPLIPAEEFARIRKRDEFIRQTALQIQKDFSEFSLEIRFSGITSTAYDELYSQVVTHLGQLLSHNTQRLSGLVYRIDLSQKQIDDYLRQWPQLSMAEGLAELIIQRELKKVLIRNYFKETQGMSGDQGLLSY